MSRSTLYTQLMVKEETTVGTYIAPDRTLEFLDEDIAYDAARDESEALRSGQKVQRSDHFDVGKVQAAGKVRLPVPNKGFGLITKHMMGAIATTTDGTGKKHSATIGDLFGKALTIQVGRPDVSGVVQPHSYLGCKIPTWKLSNSVDDYLVSELGIDAQDESVAQSLVTATAPTLTDLFHWSGGQVTLAGSNIDVMDFELEADNGLKLDRFYIRGSGKKKEPIEVKKRVYKGKFTIDWDGLTNYQRYTGATVTGLVATWSSPLTYDTAKPFKFVVSLPAVRIDGATPKTTPGDTYALEMQYVVMDDGTNQPVTLDTYTSDTTP